MQLFYQHGALFYIASINFSTCKIIMMSREDKGGFSTFLLSPCGAISQVVPSWYPGILFPPLYTYKEISSIVDCFLKLVIFPILFCLFSYVVSLHLTKARMMVSPLISWEETTMKLPGPSEINPVIIFLGISDFLRPIVMIGCNLLKICLLLTLKSNGCSDSFQEWQQGYHLCAPNLHKDKTHCWAWSGNP